jgi:hypothetical protein
MTIPGDYQTGEYHPAALSFPDIEATIIANPHGKPLRPFTGQWNRGKIRQWAMTDSEAVFSALRRFPRKLESAIVHHAL